MKWRVWYDDGTTYTSATKWDDLPEFGIICVMEYDAVGWDKNGAEIHANTEYYWLDSPSGRIRHSNVAPSITTALIKRAPVTMIPYAEYDAMKDAAILVKTP